MGSDFDGHDQLEFLDEDAPGFEELQFLVLAELFAPANIDEVVELFPTLQIVLSLVDQSATKPS